MSQSKIRQITSIKINLLTASLVVAFVHIAFIQKERDSKDDFYNAISRHLSSKFHITGKKVLGISKVKNLRTEFFYSPSLKKVIKYTYKGYIKPAVSGIKPNFVITVYHYSSVDTAKKLLEYFRKDNEHRIKAGWYGILGKDFQRFIQCSNYFVHMEGYCSFDRGEEDDFFKISDSLIGWIGKRLGQKPQDVWVPCE